MNLHLELEIAKAKVADLQARIEGANCETMGHIMKHVGGRNAGCGDRCSCSIPVYECQICGDSDYGDNAEAKETMARCAEDRDGEYPAACSNPGGHVWVCRDDNEEISYCEHCGADGNA